MASYKWEHIFGPASTSIQRCVQAAYAGNRHQAGCVDVIDRVACRGKIRNGTEVKEKLTVNRPETGRLVPQTGELIY
jgi:hypothetical protein